MKTHKKKSKILIFGAGAIGSIFAVKFSAAGYDVHVYARNKRLHVLKERGLLYEENGKIIKAPVSIIDNVNNKESFDFVFVTVRHKQMNDALFELRNNLNSNIVIMANNIKNYSEFESIVGAKKIIPAFPGAGGSIKSGVLHYRIVPKLIQRTIFGEIDGSKSVRIQKLTRIMHNSKIPYDVSKNMLAWQRSHVAMITALEMGIYFDGGDNYTTADDDAALNYICNSLKRNFCYLKKLKVRITPCWFNLFNLSPNYVIKVFLKTILSTKFAKTGIYSNKKSSKMEMEMLEKEFLKWVESEKNE